MGCRDMEETLEALRQYSRHPGVRRATQHWAAGGAGITTCPRHPPPPPNARFTDGAPPRGDAVHGEATTETHGGGIAEARGPTRRGHRGPTTTTTPSHTRGPRTPTATGALPRVRHARRAAARGRGVHSLSGDSGSPAPRFSPCARPPLGQ